MSVLSRNLKKQNITEQQQQKPEKTTQIQFIYVSDTGNM